MLENREVLDIHAVNLGMMKNFVIYLGRNLLYTRGTLSMNIFGEVNLYYISAVIISYLETV